ncbi:MAG: hypothetical protein DIZ80_16190 [endosymbiont of Galathealinum brachiosum]|uniref:HDOD domain-containing protein n=1 Tax=endosymbiont of Galathealinum brachiosum TaxID=2200906 RepID=A0A370DAK0_9GAMM|nr:MAG: hypothetical protein DIZ80_16190 [endosymbiont of Galathealinum brachiosum]
MVMIMKNDIKSAVSELIHKEMELSSLPDIYIRASEVLDDKNSTNEQIAAVVQIDPVISARLLKVVNSSFFGFEHNIASVSQAAAILGRATLRNMILGAVISGVISRISIDVFPMDDYWNHSVRTAVLTKLLANQLKGLDAEALFIAGLIHNIGKLVIAHELPNESMSIQRHIINDQLETHIAEIQLLGFDHCEVGAALIAYWGLPDIFINTTRYHNYPSDTVDYKIETLVISIACTISHLSSSAQEIDLDTLIDEHEHWLTSGLTKEQIIDTVENLEEHFKLAISIL